MKRRREIGPKREKNRRALVKFILLALLVAIVGGGLAYLAYTMIEANPIARDNDGVKDTAADNNSTDKEKAKMPFFQYVFVMIVMATIMGVLGMLFFGMRAYMMGTKVRHSLTRSRGQIKR